MAVTTELTLTGSWQLLYTNSGNTNVVIVLTAKGAGCNWAVREDTTLPADSFLGHTLEQNVDMQRIVEPGETLFVQGLTGRKLYHSTGA